VRVRFLPEADHDVDRLYGFLAGRNPSAARKAMLAIDQALLRLQENPYLGVLVRERAGDRQLSIQFGSGGYVLRYRLDEAQHTFVVVRIWHGRGERQ
jgi:plasmid stabilization system protein ParE